MGTSFLPRAPVSRTQRSDNVRHRLALLRYQLPHVGSDQPNNELGHHICDKYTYGAVPSKSFSEGFSRLFFVAFF